MDKCFCCVVLTILSLALAQQVPVVQYLRGVPRLSNASLVDYYFSCNTIGASLQWEVNQDLLSFNVGERIGIVITHSTPNFRYTATLLSSRQFQGELHTFDSVLIVSSNIDANINVACMNGIRTTSISSSIISIEQNEILNVTVPYIFLQYQFSGSILNAITTYFYLCDVNDTYHAWQTNAQALGFSNQDIIGQEKNFLSADQNVVVQQAILIGSEPNSLVSILLVTEIGGVNVTCESNRLQATLLFSDVLAAATMTTPPPFTFTTSDIDITMAAATMTTPLPSTFTTSDIDSAKDNSTTIIKTTANIDPESGINVVAVAVGVAVGVFLIFICFSVWICCVICLGLKKKHLAPGSAQESKLSLQGEKKDADNSNDLGEAEVHKKQEYSPPIGSKPNKNAINISGSAKYKKTQPFDEVIKEDSLMKLASAYVNTSGRSYSIPLTKTETLKAQMKRCLDTDAETRPDR